MSVNIISASIKKIIKVKKEQNFNVKKSKIDICIFEGNYLGAIFAVVTLNMDYPKNISKKPSRCLECGEEISYGRSDKKFCSEDCRSRHHYHQVQSSKTIRRKVMAILNRNYEVLDSLVHAGVEAVWISDVMTMGFNPGFSTFCRHHRKHDEYMCFDIHYRMTPNRISCITKIQNLSLHLQTYSKEDI